MTDDTALFEARYRALASRDARFDGQFIVGVHSTGIYCRPSCPAITPKPGNVSFYRTAAAAHEAGLRACKRCQPDAVPGAPDWNLRDDLASRAMRLIHDGLVEREGVVGLARSLGYSSRHLTRVLTAELGAGPLALARANRAQTARTLLGSTELPIADVAFAAGFRSLRQFNDTIAEIYHATPSELRALSRRGRGGSSAPDADAVAGTLALRLPARAPLDHAGLFRFFADHAVPGLEEADHARLARPLALPGGVARIEVRSEPASHTLRATVQLARLADVGTAVSRIRRAFDLDADAAAIDEALAGDPALAPLVAATPGIRIAGSFDPEEALVRALVGQQISVAAARTTLGRLVAELGPGFPSAALIAARGREVLRGPASRVDAIVGIAETLADGRLVLDVGMPLAEFRAALLAQRGIGPWTADYLAMRVFGAPDVLPVDDLVIRRSAAALGMPGTARELARHAARWAPWRSYAALHLWRARPPRVPRVARNTPSAA